MALSRVPETCRQRHWPSSIGCAGRDLPRRPSARLGRRRLDLDTTAGGAREPCLLSDPLFRRRTTSRDDPSRRSTEAIFEAGARTFWKSRQRAPGGGAQLFGVSASGFESFTPLIQDWWREEITATELDEAFMGESCETALEGPWESLLSNALTPALGIGRPLGLPPQRTSSAARSLPCPALRPMASTISVLRASAPDRSLFWSGIASRRGKIALGLGCRPGQIRLGPKLGVETLIACRHLFLAVVSQLPVAPLAVFRVRGRVGVEACSPRAGPFRRSASPSENPGRVAQTG